MISTLLACLVLSQDPDRSTPEKAIRSFHEFWQSVQNEDAALEASMEETEALGDFARTEEYKKRRTMKREERKASRAQYKMLSSTLEISKSTEDKDGSVTVEAVERRRVRRLDPETNKPVEKDETGLRKAVFEKSGGSWFVRELYRDCYLCLGAGQCSYCEGKGKQGEEDCWSCQGKKICSSCKGEKFTRDTPDEFVPDYLIADPEPAFSKDLSSPKAAAQTLADLNAKAGLSMTRSLREFIDRIMRKIRLYFAASVVKKMEDNFRKAEEAGAKRFKDQRPRVGEVEEKGDVAYVVILSGPTGEAEMRDRYVLKRVGNQWLVDAAQYRCWSCEASGKCGTCKGTGQQEGMKCYGCNGEKSCGICKGQGWIDQDGGNP